MCSSKEFQLAAVELMYLKCKEKINLKKKKTPKTTGNCSFHLIYLQWARCFSIEKKMLQIERNVAGTCILSTYNEWNCLHSYKIKSYKLIGLDKNKNRCI